MDEHDSLWAAEQRTNLALQVVKGVAVLGEHNELLARRRSRYRNRPRTVVPCGLADPSIQAGWSEDLAQQVRELAPLGVLAAAADFGGERLKPTERNDLVFELSKRRGSRGLIEDLLLGDLDFVLGSLLEILDIVCVEDGIPEGCGGRRPPALPELHLSHPLFSPPPRAAH